MLPLPPAHYRDETRQHQAALPYLDYALPADRARLLLLIRYTYATLIHWALLPGQSPEQMGILQQSVQEISNLEEAIATCSGSISRGSCGFLHQRLGGVFNRLLSKPTAVILTTTYPG